VGQTNIQTGSGGTGGSGAPTTAQYVTLATDATLSAERVLTAGANVLLTDGGANNPITVDVGTQNVAFAGDISPAQITANQNDYNPTGLSTASTLRLNSDASRDITGLAGGADGRLLFVHNVGAFGLVLKDESVSSAAGNRFALNGDLTLAGDEGCALQYDSTSSRWRVAAHGKAASAGGTPAGSDKQIQYNNAGAFGAEAGFEYDATTNELKPGDRIALAQIAAPAAPTAGVRLYSANFGPFDLPAFIAESWPAAALMPGPAQWRWRELRPQSGSTLDTLGIPHNVTGTISHPALASTNLMTSLHRARAASAAGAGSTAATRAGVTMAWRGNAAGLGGLLWYCRFATSTAVAQQRMFVGLYNTLTVLGNVNPSTMIDVIGFGYDSAGTTINYFANDGAGAATLNTCGANAPVDATTVFDAFIVCAPNDSVVWFKLVNRTTEVIALDWTSLSTDLPASTTFLAPQLWINNGTTASAAQLEMMSEVLVTPI
jgi:hypothetical protein